MHASGTAVTPTGPNADDRNRQRGRNAAWSHTAGSVTWLAFRPFDIPTRNRSDRQTVRFLYTDWTFFARCCGWVATSEKRSKIHDFAPMRSVCSKITDRRGRPPPIIFVQLVKPMNGLQLYRW